VSTVDRKANETMLMEFFLLWADDLDDALGAARHLAPRILGPIAALCLFAATGFALLHATPAMLGGVALALSATLLEMIRRRRLRLPTRHDV
jgi:hypothetical protein